VRFETGLAIVATGKSPTRHVVVLRQGKYAFEGVR